MARLLVASVILCAFCQSAFGILLRGEASGVGLAWATGTQLTLTFAVDTEYPYYVTPLSDNAIFLNTPTREFCISGAGLSLGYNGFAGGDGGFAGPDTRMTMHIPVPGLYGDPSVVLTPAMMPTATLVFSQRELAANQQYVHYTVLQDAPISWYYVPEPSTYLLALLALVALLVCVRRK